MQEKGENEGLKWKHHVNNIDKKMNKNTMKSLKSFDAKRIIRKLRSDAINNPHEAPATTSDDENWGERIRLTWDNVITSAQVKEDGGNVYRRAFTDQRRASHGAALGHSEELHVPDWFLELSDDNLEAFEKVFWLMDADHGGTIDVDELHEGLKRIDSQVTRDEVEATLKSADKTGSGAINFEEFLFMMSQAEEGSSDKKKRELKNGYTKRQCLFYSAIARFTAHDVKPPVYSVPHVIKHYTAGARLIGLSSRQLDENLKQLTHSIDKRFRDSPYAKIPSMPKEYPPRKERHRKGTPRRSRSLSPTKGQTPAPDRAGSLVPGQGIDMSLWPVDQADQPRTDEERAKWFQSMISKGYNKSSVVAMLPGLDKNFLNKLDKESGEIESKEEVPANPTMVEQKATPATTKPLSPKTGSRSSKSPRKSLTGNGKKRTRLWRTPGVAKQKVEPPVLSVKNNEVTPTAKDLPRVRKKATEALEDYYTRIRLAAVEAARKHWDKLYAEGMKSVKPHQRDRYKTVYSTYSPFMKNKVVIASQWIPGIHPPKPTGPKHVPFTFYV